MVGRIIAVFRAKAVQVDAAVKARKASSTEARSISADSSTTAVVGALLVVASFAAKVFFASASAIGAVAMAVAVADSKARARGAVRTHEALAALAFAIIADAVAIAMVQSRAPLARAICKRRVGITLAEPIHTAAAPCAVFWAALGGAVRRKWASVSFVTHTCAVAAVAVPRAAVLANGDARFSSVPIVALAHTHIVALAIAIAVAIARTHLLVTGIAAKAWGAYAPVVHALPDGRRAVVWAQDYLAAEATVAGLAKAGPLHTFPVATACTWAQFGAR